MYGLFTLTVLRASYSKQLVGKIPISKLVKELSWDIPRKNARPDFSQERN